MQQLKDLLSAVERLKSLNEERETKKRNKLFDLQSLIQASNAMAVISDLESPEPQAVTSALTLVTASLNTYGKAVRNQGLNEDTESLQALAQAVREINKTSLSVLVVFGASLGAREVGKLTGTAVRVKAGLDRRARQISDLSRHRIGH